MNIYIVISKLTGHVMGAYANYLDASELWDINLFTIAQFKVR
jgi:hypothetical protein